MEQECLFEGCSLPPKIPGHHYGDVILSVTHIIDSTVSTVGSIALYSSPLVRVRWWGEDKPGSLFRPIRLNQDTKDNNGIINQDNEDIDRSRSICMKYPIHVGPNALWKYFYDMRALDLDIIDSKTRRKYGQCSIPLHPPGLLIESIHEEEIQNMDSYQVLGSLSLDNALYEVYPVEIDSSSEQENHSTADIIGYVSVTFQVRWKNSIALDKEGKKLVEQDSMDSLLAPILQMPPKPAKKVDPAPIRRSNVILPSYSKNDQSMIKRLSPKSVDEIDWQSSPKSSKAAHEPDRASGDGKYLPNFNSSLKTIVQKGIALQKRMEKALDSSTIGQIKLSELEERDDKPEEVQIENDSDNDEIEWEKLSVVGVDEILEGPTSETEEYNMTAGRGSLEIQVETMQLNQHVIQQIVERGPLLIGAKNSPENICVAIIFTTKDFKQTDQIIIDDGSKLTNVGFTTIYGNNTWKPIKNYSKMLHVDQFLSSKIIQAVIRVSCKAKTHPSRPKYIKWFAGEFNYHDILANERNPIDMVHNIPLFVISELENIKQPKSFTSLRRKSKNIGGLLTLKLTQFRETSDQLNTTLTEESPHQESATLNRIPDDKMPLYELEKCSEAKLPYRNTVKHSVGIDTSPSVSLVESNTSTIQFDFTIMIERATELLMPHGFGQETLSNSFIKLKYSVPCSNFVVPINNLQDTPQSKTQVTQGSIYSQLSKGKLVVCSVEFNSVHYIPMSIPNSHLQSFVDSLLIIELWLCPKDAIVSDSKIDESASTFLGLGKLSLHPLYACFSSNKYSLLPRGIIDREIPITNLYLGDKSGKLHIRIAVGTKEQCRVYASTIRKVTSLQAMTRGYLIRRSTGMNMKEMNTDKIELSRQADIGLSGVEEISKSIPKQLDYEENTKLASNKKDAINLCVMSQGNTETENGQVYWHELRLKIREPLHDWCQNDSAIYQTAIFKEGIPLGLEVKGHLKVRIPSQTEMSTDQILPFALWWDGTQRNLNTNFTHKMMLQNKFPITFESQNAMEVSFELKYEMENYDCTSKLISNKAIGVVNLDSMFKKLYDEDESDTRMSDFVGHFDIPLQWNLQGDMAPCKLLPLKVFYQISCSDLPNNGLHQRAAGPAYFDSNEGNEQNIGGNDAIRNHVDNPLLLTAHQSTLRPAEVVLSIDILTIGGLGALIKENSELLANSYENQIALRKTLQSSRSQCAKNFISIDYDVCLGLEVHQNEQHTTLNAKVAMNSVNQLKYKKCCIAGIPIQISNATQHIMPADETSKSNPQKINLIIHPELLEVFQYQALEIKIYLNNEYLTERVLLGIATIPLAPVVCRSKGVLGVFPIEINAMANHICHDASLTTMIGKLGVQVMFDHDHGGNLSDETSEISSHNIPHIGVANNNFVSIQNPSQQLQVTIESAKNLMGVEQGIPPNTFVTCSFDMEPMSDQGLKPSEYTTTIVRNSSAPQWHTTLFLPLFPDYKVQKSLLFAVWEVLPQKYALDNFSSKNSISLLGYSVIDWSLLEKHNDWYEIDGWYHIQDNHNSLKGQLKVRVNLLGSKYTPFEASDNASTNLSGKLKIEHINSDIQQDNSALSISDKSDFISEAIQITFNSPRIKNIAEDNYIYVDGNLSSEENFDISGSEIESNSRVYNKTYEVEHLDHIDDTEIHEKILTASLSSESERIESENVIQETSLQSQPASLYTGPITNVQENLVDIDNVALDNTCDEKSDTSITSTYDFAQNETIYMENISAHFEHDKNFSPEHENRASENSIEELGDVIEVNTNAASRINDTGNSQQSEVKISCKDLENPSTTIESDANSMNACSREEQTEVRIHDSENEAKITSQLSPSESGVSEIDCLKNVHCFDIGVSTSSSPSLSPRKVSGLDHGFQINKDDGDIHANTDSVGCDIELDMPHDRACQCDNNKLEDTNECTDSVVILQDSRTTDDKRTIPLPEQTSDMSIQCDLANETSPSDLKNTVPTTQPVPLSLDHPNSLLSAYNSTSKPLMADFGCQCTILNEQGDHNNTGLATLVLSSEPISQIRKSDIVERNDTICDLSECQTIQSIAHEHALPHAQISHAVKSNLISPDITVQQPSIDKIKLAWGILNEVLDSFSMLTKDRANISLGVDASSSVQVNKPDMNDELQNEEESKSEKVYESNFLASLDEPNQRPGRNAPMHNCNQSNARPPNLLSADPTAEIIHINSLHNVQRQYNDVISHRTNDDTKINMKLESSKNSYTSDYVDEQCPWPTLPALSESSLSSNNSLSTMQKPKYRTLYRNDSETERIARIMQGTLHYWGVDDEDESDSDLGE